VPCRSERHISGNMAFSTARPRRLRGRPCKNSIGIPGAVPSSLSGSAGAEVTKLRPPRRNPTLGHIEAFPRALRTRVMPG
jgi:hypothetical protein